MTKAMQKLFGGIDLTWPKLAAAAAAAGVFTAVMAILPAFRDTSFHPITVTLEIWILFGILIIMNSRSNRDAALKCFVFFLISQPLVYLIQVPFSALGWGIFGYYKYWFLWTILCLPMGYIGYYMKKGKWWGYLILLPMILLTGYSYRTYLSDFLFYRPRFILICLFCIAAMILYPVAIFEDKRIRKAGALIGTAAVLACTVLCLLRPPVYSTELMVNSEEHVFDDTYSVRLEDSRYGDVEIRYLDSLEDYAVHGDLKRAGETVLILESPSGEKTEYDVQIKRNWYDIKKR